jgi:cellobiose epimerase
MRKIQNGLMCLGLVLTDALAVSCSRDGSVVVPDPSQAVALSSAPVAEGETAAYAARAAHELDSDILPFWMKHAPDTVQGGFYGRVNRAGVPDADADKGALLTARILWTFSAAYRHNGDPACRDMARRAYKDLNARFGDKENGGYYWTTDADGKPIDARKIVYGQAFAIYAMSEYYRATGDKAALDNAVRLYRLVEERCRDKVNGGYFEEFSKDWKVSRKRGEGFNGSALGALGQKSQNVHLHIMEAYTNLLRVWPDDSLRANLASLQDVLLTNIYDESTHHLRLFLDEDWTPLKGVVSFGHDIEFSWLLVESAEVLGDPARIEHARSVAVDIARTTLAEGVDADGGIFNEGTGAGGIIDTNKDWWPQAEAAVGFVNAWRISGDPVYLRASVRSWDFIEAHIVDHKYGEWFRSVKRDGTPANGPQDKVGFWKCPYHNSRACLELMDRLQAHSEVKP